MYDLLSNEATITNRLNDEKQLLLVNQGNPDEII